MLLRICALGVTMSWDEAPPGARASRPHKSWHSLAHLLDPDRPATVPGLCFGRAHAVPAGRVAGCNVAGKLSDHHKQQHAGGTPALPGGVVPMVRRGSPAGDFSESRPASFGKLPFARMPCPLFSLNPAPVPLVGTDPIGRNRGVSETDTSAPFWKSFLSSQPLADVSFAFSNPFVALRG